VVLEDSTLFDELTLLSSWDATKMRLNLCERGAKNKARIYVSFQVALGDTEVLQGQRVPAVFYDLANEIERIVMAIEAEYGPHPADRS
jgi:hypothetical protein